VEAGTSQQLKNRGSSFGTERYLHWMSSSTEAGMNPSAMSVFQMQQRQYYAMLMAQQQQMAAMAAGIQR
jgi:hypothetical protein